MITVRALAGAALDAALDDLARLRIAVFRAYPYLYDGDIGYERRYLETYRSASGAILVGAFHDAGLVGAATGMPLADHADEFGAAFAGTGIDPAAVFYCAESVLMPEWRGQGIGHRFFDLREEHARALGFARAAFSAVIRPEDHPARPADYRALDGFWRARGYAPLPGAVAHFSWRDLGEAEESAKPMQFWLRDL